MRKTIQLDEEVYNKLLKVKGKSFSSTINDFLDIHQFLNPINIKKAINEYEQLIFFAHDMNLALKNGDFLHCAMLLSDISRVLSSDNPLMNIFLSLRFDKPISDAPLKTYIIYNKKLKKYKIGRTKNNVEDRIKQIPSIEAKDTTIISVINIDFELELHRFFSKKRFSGEWFDLSSDDLIIIHNINEIVTSDIENGEHYKVIFEKCKNALEKFADSLYIKKATKLK